MRAHTEKPAMGLYIHIPFCKAKCAYCDFYSLAHSEEKMDAYTAALLRHLEEVAPRAAGMQVDTVYFGGGTPSYLGASRLARLLQAVQRRYNVVRDAEITLEANPDSAGDWKTLRTLRRAGFNRLSLGVQSTDDALLRRIGRIHTYEQVQQAVTAARRAKLTNLSLDLIYGLPGQTMEDWQRTLADAVALAPEHVSCYGLKLEEGTPLWQQRQQLTLPDDDAQADMYLYAVAALEEMGYAQYEISNFARPGRESRHNLKYWRMQEYAGFGPGAHSDFGGVRYGYVRDLDGYIAGELILAESETGETLARDYEYVMLSLRTAAGIDRRTFENRYRQRFDPMERLFVQYGQAGLAARTEGGWRLTPKGFLVSNSIIVALQEALGRQKARGRQRRQRAICASCERDRRKRKRERKLSRFFALQVFDSFGMRTFFGRTGAHCNGFVNYPVQLLRKKRRRGTLHHHGNFGACAQKERDYGEIQRKKAADGVCGSTGRGGAGRGGVSEDDARPAAQYGFSLCGHRHRRSRRQSRVGGGGDYPPHGAVHGHAGSDQGGHLHQSEQRVHGDAAV